MEKLEKLNKTLITSTASTTSSTTPCPCTSTPSPPQSSTIIPPTATSWPFYSSTSPSISSTLSSSTTLGPPDQDQSPIPLEPETLVGARPYHVYNDTKNHILDMINNTTNATTSFSNYKTNPMSQATYTGESGSSHLYVGEDYQASNSPEDDLFSNIPLEVTQFATFCCLLFIIVGVPGNLLTIIALARCKKVRNATAYFIINLSVCDLMFCCFNLPLALSMFWNRSWIHGDLMCVLFPFARYGLMAVSIFTVLAITINRYVMIGHPRLYPKMYSNRNLAIKILLIWLGSFGAVIPTLLQVWGKFDLDRTIGSCSIVSDSSERSPKTFLFLLAFVMPCSAIIICYARIFIIVRKATIKSHQSHQPIELSSPIVVANGGSPTKMVKKTSVRILDENKKRRSSSKKKDDGSTTKNTSPEHGPEMLKRPSSIGSGGSSSSGSGGIGKGNNNKSGIILLGRPSMAVIHQRGKMTSKDKKLLWMILVIFGTFVICYLPITIVKSVTKKNTNNIWNILGYILIYMTTCMNPIIYVAMSLEYRQAYKSLLYCTNENASSRTSRNQSESWHASKRHSHIKSPTSTNSEFFSSSGGGANKNRFSSSSFK